MESCAPNVNTYDSNNTYTCFNYSELVSIAKAYNSYIFKNQKCPKNILNKKKIDQNYCVINKPIDIDNKNKKDLWDSIYKRLQPMCKNEYCWLDLDLISKIDNTVLKEKILYFTFKPKMTKKINSWLSTEDINNVLKQYEYTYKKKYPNNFKFLGALPSDFYKITNVNYSDIFNYQKIGLVLNLDDHTKNGSHWVAIFIDNTLKTIEYYDSAGNLPNKNIKYFINTLYSFLKKNGNIYKIKYNTIQHQLKNTECGVYSIHFLIKRLVGVTFERICNSNIPDEQMTIFRSYIFRPRN